MIKNTLEIYKKYQNDITDFLLLLTISIYAFYKLFNIEKASLTVLLWSKAISRFLVSASPKLKKS